MPIQCRTRKKKDGDDYTVCYEPSGSTKKKKKPKKKTRRSAAAPPSRAEQAGVLVKVPLGRIDTGGPRMVGLGDRVGQKPPGDRRTRQEYLESRGMPVGVSMAIAQMRLLNFEQEIDAL
jgi:hypothetical protein